MSTATIRVFLGRSPKTWISAPLTTEVEPEQVFEACNRIGSLWSDLENLPHEWQRTLRTQLDNLGAPSMSVGDFFQIELDGRDYQTHCLPTGWGPAP